MVPAQMNGGIKMRKLLLVACLVVIAPEAGAQEAPGRVMLEAGIVGGNSVACPGHYVATSGRIGGAVSLYGMVENYRCVDLAGSANRLGASLLLGRVRWFLRPALRAGIEYDGGDVSETVGASLTLGRRYGARFMVHFGNLGDDTLVLFQMGGYLSFSPGRGQRPE